MIITENGTSLIYYPKRNEIKIILPQTMETATSTVDPVANRLVDVPEGKLAVLVNITELIFAIGERNKESE